MKVGIHDSDNKNFPNLALMKLSAFHKAKGDEVSFYDNFQSMEYDKVYSSKVFTFTDEDPYLIGDNIEYGGTGYQIENSLPDEIEHICPDYSLYNFDYSVGFLTRGCPRKCSFCFVPQKEGAIREHADFTEFARHKKIAFLDNNVLAHPHGIEQIEKLSKTNHWVDFNQGIDARLIDDGIAKRLSKLNWSHPLRMACDHKSQMKSVEKATRLLRRYDTTPSRFSCYVLVKDIEDALYRVEFLRALNVDPFAQGFIPPNGTEPELEVKRFCRWANAKPIYRSTKWMNYRNNRDTCSMKKETANKILHAQGAYKTQKKQKDETEKSVIYAIKHLKSIGKNPSKAAVARMIGQSRSHISRNYSDLFEDTA